MPLTDQELVQRLQDGDSQAFERLYGRYVDAIRRHLAGIVHEADSVEDLTQEVFLRIWNKAHQWSGRGSFKAWLYKIATNQALQTLRTQKTRRTDSLQREITAQEDSEDDACTLGDVISDDAFPDPESVYEHKVTDTYVQQQIARLSPERQEILRLVYTEECSIARASEALGIPEGTVKSRLHYAIKQLSRDMKDFLE